VSISIVDRARAAVQRVSPDIDLKQYMHREERNRVIPAEQLAEEGKRRMLLGTEPEPGLTLPWVKADGRVLIRPGKLVVWCGWSRHGKSQMLKQIMLHAMAQGEKACIASMEEEIHEVWVEMGRAALDTEEPSLKQVDDWVRFQTGKLWFYDQQGNVEAAKIKAVVRYCAEELKITQFVVDSLMMLAVDRDDYDGQARLVGELKLLAKDTGCTVHLVAHMRKRDGKGGDETPGTLHDIAGGHEIGSKADYVFNVWRDVKRKNQDNPDCVLGVEKQRGRINWLGSLGLNYHQRSRQFVEGDHAMRFWA
jgi:twinkle protein